MKKIYFILNIVCLFCIYENLFAQSYPPVTPPIVKSRNSIFVDSNEDNKKEISNDLLKKVSVLETNINNFVPMLMKNSSDINTIRDNADSLVVDLRKQLQDLKHSIKVSDLRLLDIMDRLDKLEKNKDSITYVKNPLDVELNKIKDEQNKPVKQIDNKVNSTNTVKNVENKDNQNITNKVHKQQNQNLNLNIDLQERNQYTDPLARNQIHIPNL